MLSFATSAQAVCPHLKHLDRIMLTKMACIKGYAVGAIVARLLCIDCCHASWRMCLEVLVS